MNCCQRVGTRRADTMSMISTWGPQAHNQIEPGRGAELGSDESVFELALRHMRSGVIVHGPYGEVLSSNAAALTMLGLSADQLHARRPDDPAWRVVDEYGDPVKTDDLPFVRCLRSLSPVIGVVIGVERLDGELCWLRLDASPLRDRRGDLCAVLLEMIDVTKERSVALQLARSMHQLDLVCHAAAVGLWEWHVESGELWRDDAFRTVMGPAVAPGDELRRLLAGAEPDDVAAALASVSGPTRWTCGSMSSDGTPLWITVTAEVTAAAGGQPTRIGGSVMDISDMHNATLQVSELLDAMTDGYMSIDRDWTISHVNRRAADLIDRTANDLIGTNVWRQFPDACGTEFYEQYGRAMRGDQVEFEAYYPGRDAWYEVRAHPLPYGGIAVYFRDVTARRAECLERERLLAQAERAKQELAHAATHDSLTGLANRDGLASWLTSQLAERRRTGVLYLDVDRFKLVNDSHGHGVGDEVLQEVSARLLQCVHADGIIARLGGDEFVIALTCTGRAELHAVATRVLQAFDEPFLAADRQFVVTASIGMTMTSCANDTPETLIRDADAALYRAKELGRNRFVDFDPAMWGAVLRRVTLESDLRAALAAGRIVPHFQPIFDAWSGDVVGAEALARWEGASVRPDEFIGIAEETGLIHDIGTAILHQTVASSPALFRTIVDGGRLWVNVSGRQLNDPAFAPRLIEWAAACGVTRRLGIEVTETVLADDPERSAVTLCRLSDAGFHLAIDDFGTRQSSLARLAAYPVDVLKIDRAFTRSVALPKGRGIVAAVVDLAHAVGAVACAEGIETPEELRVLRELGVDTLSGYLLARPEAAIDFAAAALAGSEYAASATDHTRQLAAARANTGGRDLRGLSKASIHSGAKFADPVGDVAHDRTHSHMSGR
jgi:diguanylate cyclase (GGDEF)-like protein/PAS domain S-box-containing protein